MENLPPVRPAVTISAVRLFGMDGSDSDRRSTFARVLEARRRALGLTQRDVYAAGGPSPATLVRWESGDGLTTPPRPTALNRLDGALRWNPGTARKLLTGEISGEEALHSRPVTDEVPGETSVDVALDPNRLITEYSARMMRYIMATMSIEGIDPALVAEGEALTEIASEHYVTLLLQQHGGPGRTLPDDISHIVLPTLSAPEPERGSVQHRRWAYRRWLAGVPFPDEDAQEFQRYWDTMNYGRIG